MNAELRIVHTRVIEKKCFVTHVRQALLFVVRFYFRRSGRWLRADSGDAAQVGFVAFGVTAEEPG
jgi:hypothetical protein